MCRGLYRATDLPMTTDIELVHACASVPHGVIFLASALFYYGLTTCYPSSVWLAVGQKDRVTRPVAPPVQLHFLTAMSQRQFARLLAYSLDSAVAEKFEAMIRFGLSNSRLKDFYDIYTISGEHDFDGRVLQGDENPDFPEVMARIREFLEPVRWSSLLQIYGTFAVVQ